MAAVTASSSSSSSSGQWGRGGIRKPTVKRTAGDEDLTFFARSEFFASNGLDDVPLSDKVEDFPKATKKEHSTKLWGGAVPRPKFWRSVSKVWQAGKSTWRSAKMSFDHSEESGLVVGGSHRKQASKGSTMSTIGDDDDDDEEGAAVGNLRRHGEVDSRLGKQQTVGCVVRWSEYEAPSTVADDFATWLPMPNSERNADNDEDEPPLNLATMIINSRSQSTVVEVAVPSPRSATTRSSSIVRGSTDEWRR